MTYECDATYKIRDSNNLRVGEKPFIQWRTRKRKKKEKVAPKRFFPLKLICDLWTFSSWWNITQSKKIQQIIIYLYIFFIYTQIKFGKNRTFKVNLIFTLSMLIAGVAVRKLFSAAGIQCVHVLNAIKLQWLPAVEVVPFKTILCLCEWTVIKPSPMNNAEHETAHGFLVLPK